MSARLLARRGELEDAELTAREAVRLADETGNGIFGPDAWSSLGEVLAVAGDKEEAAEVVAHAVQLHEQKGNTAGAARTRKLAARLGLPQ